MSRRFPRLALALARAAGQTAFTVRLAGPSPRDLAALFGRSVAPGPTGREIMARDFIGRAFDHLLMSGNWDAADALVFFEPPPHVLTAACAGRPLVFCVVHGGGPPGAVSVALHRLGLPAFIVRTERGAPRPGHAEVGATRTNGADAPRVLKQAVDRLRANCSVVLAVDGGIGTSTPPVPCLGREVRFRRGAFVLSRLGAAPLVPVISRWRGGRVPIEVLMFDPIDPPGTAGVQGERVQARQLSAWLETRLASHPEELSLPLLAEFQRTAGSGTPQFE